MFLLQMMGLMLGGGVLQGLWRRVLVANDGTDVGGVVY